ncbi:hypothetical protein ELI41_29610 (plasmid) [Rhizobium leguminosarum]|jgi:hypothetical protein|uniref:hypothetical protein n=1 Tax=Rhizobium leguminosarum TaxID=384 RepID=UPI001031AF3B|nr:hypothetical protein [Rhizobium leguminosarum]TAU80466.1 hypothetical protein ELI41_29610 [Rhizobium leguminosarum]
MPNKLVRAAAEGLPKLTRRLFIGGVAVASLPAAGMARAVMPEQPVSIDEFLAKALPSEKVRYHSNALADAMADMHPDEFGWRVQTDHEDKFVMVARRLPKRSEV